MSDKFILASGRQVQELLQRDVRGRRFCGLMLDGVEFAAEHLLVALGIEVTGRKRILGLRQGASENQPLL